MKRITLILALMIAQPLAADPPKPEEDAAKAERLVTGVIRLDVKADGRDPNPARHRTYKVLVHNLTSGTEDFAFVIYQITGETVTGTSYTTWPKCKANQTIPLTVELDVAPENGWVIVARRKTTGELVGVKGSAARFEALARKPGGLQEPLNIGK